MNRAYLIKTLSEKLIPEHLGDQLEINLHYFEKTDEEEQPFSNLCAIIRQENISLTPEDATNLGWAKGEVSSTVEVVPAALGQMFIL